MTRVMRVRDPRGSLSQILKCSALGNHPTVGCQTLTLVIGVRIPIPQLPNPGTMLGGTGHTEGLLAQPSNSSAPGETYTHEPTLPGGDGSLSAAVK